MHPCVYEVANKLHKVTSAIDTQTLACGYEMKYSYPVEIDISCNSSVRGRSQDIRHTPRAVLTFDNTLPYCKILVER